MRVFNGNIALVPQRSLRLGDWTGVGWYILDPNSGATAALISGGLSGGARMWRVKYIRKIHSSLSGYAKAQKNSLKGEIDSSSAFWNGLLYGDFDKSSYNTAAAVSSKSFGQIISGILVFGDLRDIASSLIEVVSSGGSDGKLLLTINIVALLPGLGDYVKGSKISAEAANAAADIFKNTDEAVDVYRNISKNGDEIVANLKKHASDGGKVVVNKIEGIDTAGTIITKTTPSGNSLQVQHLTVGDGKKLLADNGVAIPKSGLNRAKRIEISEKTSKILFENAGWKMVSKEVDNPFKRGVDQVFTKPDGSVLIVEVKSKDKARLLSSSQMTSRVGGKKQIQLSDHWLNSGAIDRSVDAKTITADQAKILKKALEDGTLQRQTILVNMGHTGKTVTNTFIDRIKKEAPELSEGKMGVTVVEMGVK